MSCTAKILVAITSTALVHQVFCVWSLLNPGDDQSASYFKLPLVNFLVSSAVTIGAGVATLIVAEREKPDPRIPPLTLKNATTIHELVEVGALQFRSAH